MPSETRTMPGPVGMTYRTVDMPVCSDCGKTGGKGESPQIWHLWFAASPYLDSCWMCDDCEQKFRESGR